MKRQSFRYNNEKGRLAEAIGKLPADPTKEEITECEYVFDGWYNGETKWDFENDVVEGDAVTLKKRE